MTKWRSEGDTWCLWPSQPCGLIEMIGGSYLAASPQITYRRLLEDINKEGIAIHAWSYVPSFDHQSLANRAWKSFRKCRQLLKKRVGACPDALRLGHSLGCKLHLLAPDGGRNSKALVTLSFNNFAAENSIPMLRKFAPKLGFYSEFSPSPSETMKLIKDRYIQPRNLLISFEEDTLDQSQSLLNCLKNRPYDLSQKLNLQGNHLTPASAGLRQNILGEWADDQD